MASPDRELQNKPNLVEFDLTCGSADLLGRSTRNLIPLGIIAQLVRILESLIQAARGGHVSCDCFSTFHSSFCEIVDGL